MAARQSTAGAIKPYARRIRLTCRRRRDVTVDTATEVIDILPPAFLIRCPIAMRLKGAGTAVWHGDRLEAERPSGRPRTRSVTYPPGIAPTLGAWASRPRSQHPHTVARSLLGIP